MQSGQFIRMEYDAFVKESNQLMDTTHESVAKEHDVYNEKAKYEPIPVIVGAGWVVKGLEDDLLNAELGVERQVEIDALDAFGEKDPKLIEIFPLQKVLSLPEFRKGDKYPSEGMDIHINNRIGTISRIFAGRVRVDFNSRWAGKGLVYKYKVTEVITDQTQKLRAVIDSDFGRSEEFVIQNETKDEVEIVLPDIVKLDSSWMMAKFKLVSDLRNHLGFKRIRFIEEYVRKDEPSEEGEHEHSHKHDHDHEHEHEDEHVDAPVAEPVAAEEKAPEQEPEPAEAPAPKPKRSRAKKAKS
jgi:FKBP-type peptidyl-prolyl cis-trans isomerase 2